MIADMHPARPRTAARTLLLAVLALAVSSVAAPAHAIGSAPIISATIGVGVGPAGIAVNASGTRVYVVNTIDATVTVIDAATETVVDTIDLDPSDLLGPVGVAVSPNDERLYVTNDGHGPAAGQGNTVSVVDTATHAVVTTVNVGTGPRGVAFTTDGSKALVTNYGNSTSVGNTVSVIDTATFNVSTITVDWAPKAVAVSAAGTAYVVNNAGGGGLGSVSVVDVAAGTVTHTITGFVFPEAIAISPDATRAYVPNYGSDNLSVIDLTSSPPAVLTAIAIPSLSVTFGSQPRSVAVTPTAHACTSQRRTVSR